MRSDDMLVVTELIPPVSLVDRDPLGDFAAGCVARPRRNAATTSVSRLASDEIAWRISRSTKLTGSISRMSRSLRHLLEVVHELEERAVGIVSLRESIDTGSATGRLFLSIMGAIAQMERELRAERTAAGRAAARARGRTGGRPRTPEATLEQARILYESEEMTATAAAKAAGIGRRTLYDYLDRLRAQDRPASTASPPTLLTTRPQPTRSPESRGGALSPG